jgi:hypothetical protein
VSVVPYRRDYDLDNDDIDEDSLEVNVDSIEMPPPKMKRESEDKTNLQALYELLLGIIDTLQSSTKTHIRKARERDLRRRSI